MNVELLLTTGLYFTTFACAAALFIVIYEFRNDLSPEAASTRLLVAASHLAAFAFAAACADPLYSAIAAAFATAVFFAAGRRLPDFSIAGRQFFSTFLTALFFGTWWGFWFVATIPVSATTRALLFASSAFFIVKLWVSLVQTYEMCEVIGRKRWRRPNAPLPVQPRHAYPKVCFQVPTYSEPPELVCETLDALSRVDYPDYEVMVIDNNTRDENLWRPVEAHCEKLGGRFRFFHLDECPGAKAGALNFAKQHLDDAVELIAVVDSDYVIRPDFLARLVGYFDDAKMGFVQARHSYRDWEENRYLRMCNWEYRLFFATTLISRNERNAGITVGTMSLIRRRALEEAGGWAEWCLTEDSELAVRIHACGYESVYMNADFGRGLIPETFAAYKKQRFRWVFGPVQELKRHYRLFLPPPLGKPSKLTTQQKIHHLTHGLENLEQSFWVLTLPLFCALIISMVAHQEMIDIPNVMWFCAGSTLLMTPVFTVFLYHSRMGCSAADTLGALIASAALSYTKAFASFSAVVKESTPWCRTNKFRIAPSKFRFLSSIQLEVGLGVLLSAVSLAAYLLLPKSDLATLFLVGVVMQNFSVVAAGIMAFLSEKELYEKEFGILNTPARAFSLENIFALDD